LGREFRKLWEMGKIEVEDFGERVQTPRFFSTPIEPLFSKSVLPAVWAGVLYVLPMTILWGLTWRHSKPSYRGSDWMLMGLLTFPGCLVGVYFERVLSPPFQALVGLGANWIVFYLVGLLICHLAERFG